MCNTRAGIGIASLRRIFAWLVPGILLTALIASPQSRGQKPGLIRDTDTAEGKDEPAVEAEKAYDPLMAEKIVKIGDFYLKRKNYAAAIQRYLEALQYQPNRTEAFAALGRAYEKQGDTAKAAEVYRDFINKNPDSPKTPEFRARLAKLEKKS
jgi:tetratricopeptide (TPR) repeat protein